jgi:hypothetical protein
MDGTLIPQFVDENEASNITSIPTPTLRTLRSKGGGPPFVKIGRSVRYEVTDLIAFMRRCRAFSTADADQQAGRYQFSKKRKKRAWRKGATSAAR